jgi:starch synthase
VTLRVAHITSEAVPFSKTGGLADVLGALPPALAALGAEVTVVVPAHRRTLDEEVTGTVAGVVSALGFRATIHETERRGTRVLLLDCPPLFVRPGLYGVPDGDFGDSSIRFAFFARAALTALLSRGGADVLHAHD